MFDVEYFERDSGAQPAEVFEDAIDSKLRARLRRYTQEVALQGRNLSGGIVKACRDFPNIFEIRARHHKQLARAFCVFDDKRLVLLDGIAKRDGDETPRKAFETAKSYLDEYLATRKVSPEQ